MSLSSSTAYEVQTPKIRGVRDLTLEIAILPDALARQMRFEVNVVADRGDQAAFLLRHPNQRTRRGIGSTELFEVVRPITRENDQVPLAESWRDSAGATAVVAANPLSLAARVLRKEAS